MPQKPQDRAKDKRRLTKRLAKWRAKQEQTAAAGGRRGKKPRTSTSRAKLNGRFRRGVDELAPRARLGVRAARRLAVVRSSAPRGARRAPTATSAREGLIDQEAVVGVEQRHVAGRGPAEGAAPRRRSTGTPMSWSSTLRARPAGALGERDADGLRARRDEQIEDRELVAEEHGLRRELGARVGRGEHQERVAEVLDVAGAVLQEGVADDAVGGARRLARDEAERLRRRSCPRR